MPAGAVTSSDDWETGTIAAACGGTTTVIDFVEPESGEPVCECGGEGVDTPPHSHTPYFERDSRPPR